MYFSEKYEHIFTVKVYVDAPANTRDMSDEELDAEAVAAFRAQVRDMTDAELLECMKYGEATPND